MRKCVIFICVITILITFSQPSFGLYLMQPMQQALAQIPANAYGDQNFRWWVEEPYIIKVEFRWGVVGAIWILPAQQWQPGIRPPDWSIIKRFAPIGINPDFPQRQGGYPQVQNQLTQGWWRTWNIDGREISLSWYTYYQDSQWHRREDLLHVTWFISNPSVWFFQENQSTPGGTTQPSGLQSIPGYWISSDNKIYQIVAFWDRMEITGDNCTVWCVFPIGTETRLGNEIIKIKAESDWAGSDIHSAKIYDPWDRRDVKPMTFKISADKIVGKTPGPPDSYTYILTRYR